MKTLDIDCLLLDQLEDSKLICDTMDRNKVIEMKLLLEKIPKGKITTYAMLAKKLKMHPRYVGKMLGNNPYGITYPCFKVIRSDGNLGGYTSKRGVKDKIEKLKKDGIEIKNNKINLKKFLFAFKR